MTSEPFANTSISPLADAVASGNAAEVRRQLESGTNPETPGSDGASLLVWAIDRGLVDGAMALLEGGADPNHPDADGTTPVHAAAFADDAALLRAVLAHGGNPDVRNPVTGASPLAASILNRNAEPMRILLEAGADPDLADRNQDTPLHVAARTNKGEAILLLLERGASPLASNGRGASFQRHYFNYRRELLNERALGERRQIVAWLKENGIPLEANVDADY
ncbi:ankyrin repeat domain-containing protein [Luteimonas sp. A478]